MSASPTNANLSRSRGDAGAKSAGGRVYEQPPAYYAPGREALQALLAFSSLHEQIRQRRARQIRPDLAGQPAIWESEQFLLDEVLQLVSERALAITGTDGVAIALAEGEDIRCRASAGRMAPDVGARLDPNSGFSGACLRTGLIVRCDDSEKDPRVDREACRRLGLHSIVSVPLMTERGVIGLLAAFCSEPYGFNDSDVRSLSLLGELILAAMKPEEDAPAAPEDVALLPGDHQPSAPSIPASKIDAPTGGRPPEELATSPQNARDQDVTAQIAVGSQPNETEALQLPNMQALREALARVTEESSVIPTSDPNKAPDIFPGFSFSQIPFAQDAEPQESKHGSVAAIALLVLVALALIGGVLLWWQLHRRTQTAAPSAPQAMAPSESRGQAELPPPSAASDSGSTSSEQKESSLAVTGVRHWSSPDSSTVAIDLQNQVQYEAHRLSNPERIYFDLHDTTLVGGLPSSIEVGDALLVRIRVAQPSPDVTRVVLETKDSPNFSVSMETKPYRLIVEIRSVTAKPSAKLNLFAPANPSSASRSHALVASSPATWLEPPATASSPESLALARSSKFRIVLDAGHGGWDLGTVGRKGLLEKNLVLDIVARVGSLVTGRLHAEVIYTRRDDTYVPLEKRTETANLAQADMFLSVHGNYSDLPSARGVETYYTNTYSSVHARAHDGEGAEETNVDLTNVDVREKVQQSRHLAERVQQALYHTLLKKDAAVRDRGVRQASYVVLTGTTMPAVLAEVSFVSSPTDEARMEDPAYRQQIAEALYKGIAAYAENSHRVNLASASARPAGQ